MALSNQDLSQVWIPDPADSHRATETGQHLPGAAVISSLVRYILDVRTLVHAHT